MKNPLLQLRENLGLTNEKLAFLLNLSVATINRIEEGFTQIPPKCFPYLEKMGINPKELASEQALFIDNKRNEMLASLKDKLGNSKEKK